MQPTGFALSSSRGVLLFENNYVAYDRDFFCLALGGVDYPYDLADKYQCGGDLEENAYDRDIGADAAHDADQEEHQTLIGVESCEL